MLERYVIVEVRGDDTRNNNGAEQWRSFQLPRYSSVSFSSSLSVASRVDSDTLPNKQYSAVVAWPTSRLLKAFVSISDR